MIFIFVENLIRLSFSVIQSAVSYTYSGNEKEIKAAEEIISCILLAAT